MIIDMSNITIASQAAAKLTALAKSWNDAYPKDNVVPALFMIKLKKGGEAVGIGFRPIIHSTIDEYVARMGNLQVLVDFPEATREAYKQSILTFDGENFDLKVE